VRAQPVGFQIQRLLLEHVFHFPSGTVAFLVEPLRQQLLSGVIDKALITRVVKTGGQLARQAQAVIDLAQVQHAPVA